MNVKQFLDKYRPMLVEAVESVSAGRQGAGSASNLAWEIIDSWSSVEANASYEPGEETFWCVVWSAQHLGDDEHVGDGAFARTMEELIPLLKNGGSLPEAPEGICPFHSSCCYPGTSGRVSVGLRAGIVEKWMRNREILQR